MHATSPIISSQMEDYFIRRKKSYAGASQVWCRKQSISYTRLRWWKVVGVVCELDPPGHARCLRVPDPPCLKASVRLVVGFNVAMR